MTLTQQMNSNRRRSALLFMGFIAIYVLLGAVLSQWFGTTALLIAVAVAGGMTISSLFFGDDMAVTVAGGRQIKSREEAPELWDSVEINAIAAGVDMPRVFVSPDPTPNAFAAGRSQKQALVCVNKGLLRTLDKEELDGVIAHEMAHIRNLDVRLMTYAAVLAGSIALISELLLRFLFYGGDVRDRGGIPLMIGGLIAIILAPIAATLIQMAVSRRREFLADATAADLTRYPQGLASALERIAMPAASKGEAGETKASSAIAHLYISPVKLEAKGITGALFSTHPPTEERLAKLAELSGGVRHQHSPREPSQAMRALLGDSGPAGEGDSREFRQGRSQRPGRHRRNPHW